MTPALHTRKPRRRKLAVFVSGLVLVLLATFVVGPDGNVGCVDPDAETSPDGNWTLSLCTRPMWFAMPGQSGDAPAWIVLRGRTGEIGGVSGLEMVQMYHDTGTPTMWEADAVEVPMVARLALPPPRGAARRWLDDRIWRVRALLGMTDTSDMFH